MDPLKRYDIKALLRNSDLRRRLIVKATVATQAREGIDITKAQAENSYYIVTEGERAAFFGLVPYRSQAGENDGRHSEFVKTLGNSRFSVRADVALGDFASIDDAPLAYDRLALVGSLFRDNPKLDPVLANAVVGLQTSEDARFVRCWWELPAEQNTSAPRWRPFAKGGGYSRFYSDVYLSILWTDEAIARINDVGRLQNTDYYFRPGLTWPLRTQRGFSVRRLPAGCIFGHKGPGIFSKKPDDDWFLLGVLNSQLAEFLLRAMISFGSWEVGAIKKVPIPKAAKANAHDLSALSLRIHDIKATWDTGNEICTRFKQPWVLQPQVTQTAPSLSAALDAVLATESAIDAEVSSLYTKINDRVYLLYGVNDILRKKIEGAIGERPSEIVWPQMEGQDKDQKRREHVERLLCYLVKRLVDTGSDGIGCIQRVAHEPPLIERLRNELASAFPSQDPSSLETEVVNELKKKTKGYRRAESVAEWLSDVFFDTHNALYKQRPILWHLASSQTRPEPGFACIVHAHRFDRDALAKLRSVYVRDRILTLRREAGQAAQDGKDSERLDLLALAEEVEAFDVKLKLLQEGAHAGAEGGDCDYRILPPWKTAGSRPQGWDPDLDDGIKENLRPLARTGILRIELRLGETGGEE